MKSILIHSELWSYVCGQKVKTKEMTAEEKATWDAKDEKALAAIILCLKPNQLNYIKYCESSAQAWQKLKEIHQPSSPVRKVSLFKSLINTKLNDESMTQHLDKFSEINEKLREIDINVTDELLVIILLSSLPSSYENFVVAIESRDYLPSFELLKIKLLEESRRRNDELNREYDTQNQQAFAAQTQPKTKVQKSSQTQRYISENHKRCYNCGKSGHIGKYCRTKKTPFSQNNKVSYHFSMTATVSSLFNMNQWCIDSGATSHMCCKRNLFVTYQKSDQTIQLAGGKYIKASGIGKVVIKMKNHNITLNEVLHVPDLQTNFLSVSKITKNFKVEFDKNSVSVLDVAGNLIMKAYKKDSLYIFENEKFVEKLGFTRSSQENLLKWHRRFGHLNIKDLVQLNGKNMVKGIKIENCLENINCVTCMKAKICVKSFPKKTMSHTRDLLEIIHTDVCGPMKVKSLGGSRYFVTFIDDKSRKVFVYFIKEKSEVFSVFKKFKKSVENETGRMIKILRSDNGTEYLNNDFNKFLEDHGIRRQLTATYTPQQNGVAERANRTIVEMARCLLIDSNLNEYLWAEAVNTSVYLRNRSPSKILEGKTPQEIWSGRKPTVSHLRVFGSRAIVLDRAQGKSKFQAKGQDHIFVGYSSSSKTYRLLNTQTRNIVTSRNVLFIEENGKLNQNENLINFDIVDTNPLVATSSEESGQNKNEENSRDAIQDADNIIKRRPGRPKLIKTGKPGRPSKQYHQSLNNITAITVPNSVSEALSRSDADKWLKAMQDEYTSLLSNNTWKLVPLPQGHRAIGCKWVFNIKRDQMGNVERYKARLVAKGCGQKYGVNYSETFSPVIRYTSFRIILAMAVEYNLLVHQMDVSSAYLNGELDEEVYMNQPEHFINPEHPELVLKLNKSIYGLKQSGRIWNKTIDTVLKKIGFVQCQYEPCVYTMNTKGSINVIGLYVDDLLIACKEEKMLKEIKEKIQNSFQVVDKGKIKLFLGIEVNRENDRGSLTISNRQYIRELLQTYDMLNCKNRSTPMESVLICEGDKCEEVDSTSYQSLIGSLLYLSLTTRPDISHSVNKLSQFNKAPHREHLVAARQILKYLNTTQNVALVYRKTQKPLEVYVDADWGSDKADRKSYTGFAFFLANGVISWESRKQNLVALSSTEAEYVALSTASKEAVYLRKILVEIGLKDFVSEPTIVKSDNLSAHQLAKNPVYHTRTKHIDLKYHYVREAINGKEITLKYVPTDEMIADILTKNLCKIKHQKFFNELGLQNMR